MYYLEKCEFIVYSSWMDSFWEFSSFTGNVLGSLRSNIFLARFLLQILFVHSWWFSRMISSKFTRISLIFLGYQKFFNKLIMMQFFINVNAVNILLNGVNSVINRRTKRRIRICIHWMARKSIEYSVNERLKVIF